MSYTVTFVRAAKAKPKRKDLSTRKPVKGGATAKATR
jgi:hypothetical protein